MLNTENRKKKLKIGIAIFASLVIALGLGFSQTTSKYLGKNPTSGSYTMKVNEYTTSVYHYTGGVQTFTAKQPGYYYVVAYGGNGGAAGKSEWTEYPNPPQGSSGAVNSGVFEISTANTSINVSVGGAGASGGTTSANKDDVTTGGWGGVLGSGGNGGAGGNGTMNDTRDGSAGGAGGGASGIYLGTLSSGGTYLVAGGGAGAGGLQGRGTNSYPTHMESGNGYDPNYLNNSVNGANGSDGVYQAGSFGSGGGGAGGGGYPKGGQAGPNGAGSDHDTSMGGGGFTGQSSTHNTTTDSIERPLPTINKATYEASGNGLVVIVYLGNW